MTSPHLHLALGTASEELSSSRSSLQTLSAHGCDKCAQFISFIGVLLVQPRTGLLTPQ